MLEHDRADEQRGWRVLPLVFALAAVLLVPSWFDPDPTYTGLDPTRAGKHAVLELCAALALASAFAVAIRDGRVRVVPRAADAALLGFLVWFSSSRAFAASPTATDDATLALAAAAAVGAFARPAAGDAPRGRAVLWVVIASAILAVIVELIAERTFERARDRQVVTSAAGFGSIVFGSKALAAAYLAPVASVSLSFAFAGCGRRFAAVIAAFGLFAALAFVGVKTAFLAALLGPLMAGSVVFFARRVQAITRGRRARAAALVAVAGVVGMGAVALLAQPEVSRVLKRGINSTLGGVGIDPRSGSARSAVWKLAASMAIEHPRTGVGGGNFDTALVRLDPHDPKIPANFERLEERDAHNQLLHVAAELGVVGLLLFAAYVLSLVVAIARSASTAPADDDAHTRCSVARACLSGLSVVFVVSLVQTPIASPTGALLFFVLAGVGLASCAASRAEIRVPAPIRFVVLPAAIAAIALLVPRFVLGNPKQATLLAAAERAHAAGDLRLAADTAIRACAVGTPNRFALRKMGDVDLARGDDEAALRAFESGTRSFPDDRNLWFGRIDSLVALRRMDEALDVVHDARRRFPHERELDRLVARAHLSAARLDEAIDVLEKSRAGGGESPAALLVLADAYYSRAIRDHSVADARSAQAFYEQVRAHGVGSETRRVSDRIDQLAGWIRLGAIELPGAQTQKNPR